MKLQIERLIVWPKKEGFDPREIEFKPNCVNVLSGDSRTGKSAVVAIIDYCLGSHDCSVPGGKVRENASWFGIVISTADGRHLLAREILMQSGKRRAISSSSHLNRTSPFQRQLKRT